MVRVFAVLMMCFGLLVGCGERPGYGPDVSQAVQGLTEIKFVQINQAQGAAGSTSTKAVYKSAQTAGNFNAVRIGWEDGTAKVKTVQDSAGNSYSLAGGPVVLDNEVSVVVYYAPNIKSSSANSNTVTVTWDKAPTFPDVEVAEYSGIATSNPVDVTATGSGKNLTTIKTGNITPSSVPALIFVVDATPGQTSAAGSGFTKRLITSNHAIVEDKIMTVSGTVTPSATLSPKNDFVMLAVGFKGADSTPPDTTAPTAPSSLKVSAISQSRIDLSWTASTDAVGVTGYKVERCSGAGCSVFTQVGTPNGTSYSDTGLSSGTEYSYRVRATDAAGNLSSYSSTATASTPAPDTTPPSAPGDFAASAVSPNEIDLSWTSSTDDVGVTSYSVVSCQGVGCSIFSAVVKTQGTALVYKSLKPSTSYTFKITAEDAAGNVSSSSQVSQTTLDDTSAPTVPQSLTAKASNGKVNLSWQASTDDQGVSIYYVEKCSGDGCSNFSSLTSTANLSYSDTDIVQDTSYSYRVSAADAAGNLSGWSNTASAIYTVSDVPEVVQRVAYGALFSGQGLSSDSFTFRLPNTIQEGNCGILFVDYDHGKTLTVSDGGSNSWPANPDVSVDSGVGNMKTEVYVLQGAANSDAQSITLKFSGKVSTLHPLYAEYNNCGGVGVSAKTATATAPTIKTAAITPESGSLVLHYAMQNDNLIGQQGTGPVTKWVADTGWQLEAADYANGNSNDHADMNAYALQETISDGTQVTPTLTTSGTNSYASIAIEIQAATGGVAPPDPETGGVYIKRTTFLTHTNIAQNPWKQPFPCDGNTIVVMDGQGIVQNAPSDSNGNSWTLDVKGDQNSTASASHATNVACSRDMVISMPMNGSPSRNTTVWLFDITGADTISPVAQSVHMDATVASGNFCGHPVITPKNENSLLLAIAPIGIGPLTSLTSPSGGRFMAVLYPGETDFDTFNNADGYAIEYVGADLSKRDFCWGFGGRENAYSTGLEVKAAQ